MESFHTGILNQQLWWLHWDECVRGIHPYAPFTLGIRLSDARRTEGISQPQGTRWTCL